MSQISLQTRQSHICTRDRWLISLEFVIIFMSLGAFFPFINLFLKNELKWTGTQIGLVTALGSGLVLITQPGWGRLADATDKSRVLAVALGVSSVLALVFPFVSGFMLFAVLRLVHSVFFGSVISMYDGIVLDRLGEDSEAYGRYRLWGSLGFALATLVLGKVYEATSFTSMFIAYSLLVALGCGVALLLRLPGEGGEPERQPVRLGPVLTNSTLLLLLSGIFLVMTPNAAGEQFLAIYFDALGAPPSLTGYAWTITALVEIPVFLVAPVVIQRLGTRQTLVISTALFALKLLFNGIFIHAVVALFLQLLAGIGFALYQTSSVLMVDALVPRSLRSTGQAVLGTVSWSLTGIIGSLVFGSLLDAVGIVSTFRVGGYIGLLGTLFLYLFVPVEKEQAGMRGI